jgi:hypothetical protein
MDKYIRNRFLLIALLMLNHHIFEVTDWKFYLVAILLVIGVGKLIKPKK